MVPLIHRALLFLKARANLSPSQPLLRYNVEDVKVDNLSVGAVASYTFTNVQANHLISATFKIGGTSCSTPPAMPTGLSSPKSQTSSSVNLSWNAVSSPSGCTVSYNVYNGSSLAATVSSASAVIPRDYPPIPQTVLPSPPRTLLVLPALSLALSVKTSGSYTPQQILSAIQSHMTSSVQEIHSPYQHDDASNERERLPGNAWRLCLHLRHGH